MLNRDIWQHKNQKYKEQEILQEVLLLIHRYIKQFLKILLNIDKNNV